MASMRTRAAGDLTEVNERVVALAEDGWRGGGERTGHVSALRRAKLAEHYTHVRIHGVDRPEVGDCK